MGQNTGIVFIHGAGLNSSIWNDLKKELPFPSLVIDFPNRKAGDKINYDLTFDDYVSSVVEKVKNWKSDQFIIVAHSIGACVGLKAAELFTDELKGFIAISSVIPKNGQSFVSALPFPQKILMPLILKVFGTKPPQKVIESELCNDLNPSQTEIITREFTPESRALYTSKIFFSLPDVSRLYIKLTNDKSIPDTLQDSMAVNFDANKVITIDSGHLPMLSASLRLAGIINKYILDLQSGNR
jgi:pimeloyl-ACP methyl ester carboxylesterase